MSKDKSFTEDVLRPFDKQKRDRSVGILLPLSKRDMVCLLKPLLADNSCWVSLRFLRSSDNKLLKDSIKLCEIKVLSMYKEYSNADLLAFASGWQGWPVGSAY
jgi:hypothetical protein